MSRLLQQTWSDWQVWSGHMQFMLQEVRQGYWYQEAGLNSRHTTFHNPRIAMSKKEN